MKVHCGEIQKFLGMTLDFSSNSHVKISMFKYVKDIISSWDVVVPGVDADGFKLIQLTNHKGKVTPAADNLFKVNEDSQKLPQTMATSFHNVVTKALYVVKRMRPDISTAIASLTTRVRSPDVDNWRKLQQMIEYLRFTHDLPLILGADKSGTLQWYVDASFAMHPNMRGQTGGGLTMGRGFPITVSTKQKLNTCSSTESELVGANNLMPIVLWTQYFLKAQGYDVHHNIVYQDNQSAILLECDGKASSSKRMKHINMRYYFIKDRIDSKEVNVEWCRTKDMIANFMTKPLQGAAFTRFRNHIMGVVPSGIRS